VCKPPPTPKFETKMIRDSNLDFRINLDPDVRRICCKIVECGCIISSTSVILPNMVQIGCWLYENWQNREMLTNVRKSPIPQWWRKWKSDRNPRADPNHHQKSISSRGSPLAHACQVWSTSVSAFVSYPVYKWQNEWKNDRERSHNIRLIGGGNHNNNNNML